METHIQTKLSLYKVNMPLVDSSATHIHTHTHTRDRSFGRLLLTQVCILKNWCLKLQIPWGRTDTLFIYFVLLQLMDLKNTKHVVTCFVLKNVFIGYNLIFCVWCRDSDPTVVVNVYSFLAGEPHVVRLCVVSYSYIIGFFSPKAVLKNI